MGKGTQNAFEKIKHTLIKPPALYMPNSTGRFHLYSDTSKFAMGSALCSRAQLISQCVDTGQLNVLL